MMPTQALTINAPRPRLIPSLTAGFNMVANHIAVILFPVALDLLLWFSPRLRISELLQPYVNEWLGNVSAQAEAAAMTQSLSAAQSNIQSILDQTNLFYFFSGFPIGIPSLIAGSGYSENPTGAATIYEMPNPETAILASVLIALVGIVLGSLYFNHVSRLSAKEPLPFTIPVALRQVGQSLLLALVLVAAILLIVLPLFLLASVFIMIAPGTAQIALSLAFIVLFWLALPLYFCAHGIFVFQQSALSSIVTSRRLVRAFLPGVMLFIIAAVLLTSSLDFLWLSAPETSWLSLVGIIAHGFISTAVLAASFVYYRTGVQWLQEYLQKISDLHTRLNTPAAPK